MVDEVKVQREPESPSSFLLRRLPDIPKWVETRSLLLSGDCSILGYSRRPLSALIASLDRRLACAVGPVATGWMANLLARRSPQLTVLAEVAHQAHMEAVLAGWRSEKALVHRLAEGLNREFSSSGCRLVSLEELCQAPGLPVNLLAELVEAAGRGPICGAFEGGSPVSFCYATAQTALLWDVSVDTLQGFRGRGFGARVVGWMINHQRQFGREPVWGALESNTASLRLAAKLGFRVVDQLAVFSAATGTG